jgi:hypothetical protein
MPNALALPLDLESEKSNATTLFDSSDSGTLTLFRKPATPDPFVNAALTSLGNDEKGEERFWISCVNSLSGATSFLINEHGQYKTFEWSTEERGVNAIYSVVAQDVNTLWVTGGALQHFIRLDLATGDREFYPWGGGRFVTAGMALDPDTGKLFAGAQTALISFDTKTRETIRIYGEDERPPDNHHYNHWRLDDGSYGFILETPGLSYLRWDPKEESVSWHRIAEDASHPAVGNIRSLKYCDGNKAYLPYLGWFDGLTHEITPHEHPPEEEAAWFGQMGHQVLGNQVDRNSGGVTVVCWDTTTGKTTKRLSVPNITPFGLALTESGKILTMDVYGGFKRYDALTGDLELSKRVGPEHQHRCNVILPVDDRRVTGTPFISQNFWEYDTKTSSGFCAGRAGGSFGQVDYGVRVNGKVYFSIYGGGQLTEYDPQRHATFPINPIQVAINGQGQHGAGITTDGQVIWVAFKPKYGTLDGAMIRYDTAKGEASYKNGAIPSQHVLNPVYDEATNELVAGTSYLSDCLTATPVHNTAFAVLLDPVTMEITGKATGPEGVDTLQCHGPLGDSQWLFQIGQKLAQFSTPEATLSASELELPNGTSKILFAGRPGLFILQAGDDLYEWDTVAGTSEQILSLQPGLVNRWWIHGADITFDCGQYAAVWRNWNQ